MQAECVTVTKATSGSVTTASGAGVLGASGNISDGVTVTGNLTGGSPTGNVTFYTCGPLASNPEACSASSSDLLATQTVSLTKGTSPASSVVDHAVHADDDGHLVLRRHLRR